MRGIRLLVAGSLLAPSVASAQVRASEPAMVAQTIDGTRMTVEYSRPRARTRDSLFGRVVRWGETWTPGANLATTLEVSKDVKVNGHPLPKGKYSVWMVVRPSGPWTAVFDPRPRLFHTMHPDSTPNQIRFPVERTEAPFLEALTWSFSDIRRTGVALVMQWGTVKVPLEIEVTPSLTLTFPQDRAGPYLGSYRVTRLGGPGAGTPTTLHVTHEGGHLMGRWDPSPFPEWERFYLISVGPDQFLPGFLLNGALNDVERAMAFHFALAAGSATGFEVKMDENLVMARGTRLP
jgi:hypothetical protein